MVLASAEGIDSTSLVSSDSLSPSAATACLRELKLSASLLSSLSDELSSPAAGGSEEYQSDKDNRLMPLPALGLGEQSDTSSAAGVAAGEGVLSAASLPLSSLSDVLSSPAAGGSE